MPSKSVIGLSTRSFVCSLAVLCLLPFAIPAQFSPIPLKAESFNHDLVVEHTAPVPIIPVTTASVATGAANGGFSWFEKGYNADWPATGLPSAGTIVQSEFSMEREYQFAPDYRTNNGVLIDSTFKNAQLSLVSPGPWAVLSFLIGGRLVDGNRHDSLQGLAG
jgi:hypothetical protein